MAHPTKFRLKQPKSSTPRFYPAVLYWTIHISSYLGLTKLIQQLHQMILLSRYIFILSSITFYHCTVSYFVVKIVLTWEKNCSSDRENLLKLEAEGRDICKNFEISRTTYSNSERSEQILVTECFFNLFLEVSQI